MKKAIIATFVFLAMQAIVPAIGTFILGAFASGSRLDLGPTAPAKGLTLLRVLYPGQEEQGRELLLSDDPWQAEFLPDGPELLPPKPLDLTEKPLDGEGRLG